MRSPDVLRGLAFAIALCVVTSGGCERNQLGRKAISGTILFNGQPLDTGSIQFSPHQHAGIASGGVIENGSYRIARETGLPPGKYLVRVFSPLDVAPAPQEVTLPGPTETRARGPSQPPPAEERIPPEYNVRSTQVIEVTKGGDNTFNFDIPS